MQPSSKKNITKPLQSPTEFGRSGMNRTAKSSEGPAADQSDQNSARPMTSQKIPQITTNKFVDISDQPGGIQMP